jgi:hypothetical protein
VCAQGLSAAAETWNSVTSGGSCAGCHHSWPTRSSCWARFCGPQTLQGLLDRVDDAGAERAAASIPFLLTIRWLQDALFDIGRGAEPDLRRLREHLRV